MKQFKTVAGTKIRGFTCGRSNVFLVTGDNYNILVDTGPAFIGNKLLKKLDQLSIGSIDYLLLTHTHFDHAGNAKKLKDKYGLKVIVHKTEADYLSSGHSPVPSGTNTIIDWLAKTFGKWLENKVSYEPCTADIILNDEIDLSVNGLNAIVIYTPGHSSGSLSLIVDDEIALVGDTLFGTYPGSCFPPFADDVPGLLKSWEKLLKTGCTLFLPSHGRARTRKMVEKRLAMRRKTLD